MNVAELVGEAEITIESRDQPEPDSSEVLIEISRVGICGSDLHWYEHGQMGDRVVEVPLVLGHESSGKIVAIGTEVSGFSTGERVTIEPGIPCGSCQYCRKGNYNLCPNVQFMSTPGTDGALQEYVTWPAEFVHKIPDSVTMTEAALCEPLNVGIQAAQRGDIGMGDTVLIMGAGPIGRMVQECAKAAGAKKIIVVDIVKKKLEKALDQGADIAINSQSQDITNIVQRETLNGVDVAVEATGVAPAIEAVPSTVRRGGTVVLVGLAANQTSSIDTYQLVRNQIDIRGSYRFANTYPTAIGLTARHDTSIEEIVDFHVPLEDVSDGFERASNPEIVKGIVDLA